MKDTYPHTYNSLMSIISLEDEFSIDALDDLDQKELAAALMRDDEDIYVESLLDPQIKTVVNKLLINSSDYQLVLTELLQRVVLKNYTHLINEILNDIESAKQEYINEKKHIVKTCGMNALHSNHI